MQKYIDAFKKSTISLIIFTLVCGVIYTLGMHLIGHGLFTKQVNGSQIIIDGKNYGSELLGQPFSDMNHLWGRVSSIDTTTYQDKNGEALVYGGASNSAVYSEEYEAAVNERVELIKMSSSQDEQTKVPVELVSGSGSGLDPHISYAAAIYQIPRLVENTDLSKAEITSIIDKYTEEPLLGIVGEKIVNVLKVNLAMDGILK